MAPSSWLWSYESQLVGGYAAWRSWIQGHWRKNPSSGREEDLYPGPPDYKSSALPLGHSLLLYTINKIKSYHDYAVCILIRFPVVSRKWEWQLELYNPFVGRSLGSNTTHFKNFAEVNLKPVVWSVIILLSAPSTSVIVQPSVSRLEGTWIYSTSSEETVRNDAGTRNSDRISQAFWFR